MSFGSSEIAAVLRRQITSGEIPSRERLPAERQLAETYDVARGTVRAALTLLEAEGLVETRSGSGTYVTFVQKSDDSANSVIANARPLELMDVRFALEPHICRLAVLHARSTDLAKAFELLEIMENNVTDPVAFAAADMNLHKVLAESTGNSLLIWIMAKISDVRDQDEWAHMRYLTLGKETIREYNIQHRKIIEAIQARDSETAARVMKEHLEKARWTLMRAAET